MHFKIIQTSNYGSVIVAIVIDNFTIITREIGCIELPTLQESPVMEREYHFRYRRISVVILYFAFSISL